MQPETMTVDVVAKDRTQDLVRLRRFLKGDLVLPADAGFERARQVWNGLVDKHPAAIAYCLGVDDVAAALSFAQENGMPISVRSGGHNIAGNAVCEAGLVIATGPHREQIERRLQAGGVDLDAARAGGQYIALDASETLGELGRPPRHVHVVVLVQARGDVHVCP